ncbi:MAG: ATP-grasp domain-containing protein [Armatimonadetes bacterium]|nr:ATP-grasp domain-containing protein [Armatimonadota bacterium]
MDMRVLILDGETRAALAVARSLGRAGVELAVAAPTPCLAGRSRYCHRTLACPDPSRHAAEFIDFLKIEPKALGYDLIISSSDITARLLSEARRHLPVPTQAMLPPEDALEAVLDKRRLLNLAAESGVPVPVTWDVVPGELGEMALPVIVKSRRSRERAGDTWLEGRVRVARDAQEFVEVFEEVHRLTPNPLVQEYVPGWGEGLFVLCNHGKLRAVFAHKRLRETPPDGGVSSLRESIAVDDGLLEGVTAMVEKLNWHGPAMFEFRRDSRDNTPKLLEVNPRFWGSLHLAIASGQDFPLLLYRMALDGDIEPALDYKIGVHSRWVLGDFNRLLLVLTAPKNGHASRTREIINFLKLGGNTHLEIESLSDPGPAVFEYRAYTAELARTAFGKLRRNHSHPQHPEPIHTQHPEPVEGRGLISGIMHVHSDYSVDGSLTISEIRDYCLGSGLAFACITDHAEDVSPVQFERLVRECEDASDDLFDALPGLEFPVGKAHVLALGLWTAPRAACGLPALREAKGNGALIVLAHPRFGGSDISPDLLDVLDGVEVWNGRYDGGFVPDPDVLRLHQQLAARKPTLVAFGGCDLHDREQRGIIRMVIRTSIAPSDILSTLGVGRFETRGLLWRLDSSGLPTYPVPFGMSAFRGAYTSAKRLRGFLRRPSMSGRSK